MEAHRLIIPDEADYHQLLRVADAAGLQVAADGTVSKKPTRPRRSREELLAIIAKGADVSNIPDPLGGSASSGRVAICRLGNDEQPIPHYLATMQAHPRGSLVAGGGVPQSRAVSTRLA
jgi:hypothetical protein